MHHEHNYIVASNGHPRSSPESPLCLARHARAGETDGSKVKLNILKVPFGLSSHEVVATSALQFGTLSSVFRSRALTRSTATPKAMPNRELWVPESADTMARVQPIGPLQVATHKVWCATPSASSRPVHTTPQSRTSRGTTSWGNMDTERHPISKFGPASSRAAVDIPVLSLSPARCSPVIRC